MRITFKYPKLLLLAFTVVLAYVLFQEQQVPLVHENLVHMEYGGIFLTGLFYTYSFTAAPATVVLLLLAEEHNILLVGIIAGFGSLLADIVLFRYIRHSFSDEIKELSREKIIHYFNKRSPQFLKKYGLPIIAGFIIASPLPDEIGISLLAASGSFTTKGFLLFSYTLNTLGILAILWIGTAL